MDILLHEITHSEITHGILIMRMNDGTKRFFEQLTERFTVNLRGEKLFERRVASGKIWMGITQMAKFRPGEIIRFTITNDEVIIN